ncbi:MAG: beta-propeller domain-containing protein [Candidatus Woesearchaeota archaeon]
MKKTTSHSTKKLTTKNSKKNVSLSLLIALGVVFIAAGLFIGLLVFSDSQPFEPRSFSLYSASSTFVSDAGFEAGKLAFSSEEEYVSFLNEQQSQQSNYYRGDSLSGAFSVDGINAKNDIAVNSDSTSLVQSSSFSEDDSSDYSKTNNQIATVDEADLIKTNGNYIYTVTDETLFIVDANKSEDANVVATYEFNQVAQSLFLEDDMLAVFSYSHSRPEAFSDDMIAKIGSWPRQGMTTVTFLNVSNPQDPQLVQKYQLEGRYDTARLSDGYIYLILHQNPYARDSHPTPIILQEDKVTSIAAKNIFYYPQPYNNPQLVLTHSFNFADTQLVESTAVTVDYANDVYVSKKAIYLTGYDHFSEHEFTQNILQDELSSYLTTADTELIQKIRAVDSDILSAWEKEQKILQVYYDILHSLSSSQQENIQERVDEKTYELMSEMEYFDYTTISKLAYDKGKLNLVASTKVPGRILNQFSLDESEDEILRVATTQSQTRFSYKDLHRESTSAVWTFDEDLRELGSLEDLAQEESIYAVRFIQDRLYIVTFEQIDPFFVIDLSDATQPEVLGELKIPGFSNYLHPYDENHIIGIGRDATTSGRLQGLKISLFNVEDVTNPIEVTSYVGEDKYAQTTATYEHKAFLFSKEKNLLVIPAHNAGYDDTNVYNGAFWFTITPEDISLEGVIDHSMATHESSSMYRHQPLVERSLFIDDVLYTKSPTLIRLHNLETKKAITNVKLIQSSNMDML